MKIQESKINILPMSGVEPEYMYNKKNLINAVSDSGESHLAIQTLQNSCRNTWRPFYCKNDDS